MRILCVYVLLFIWGGRSNAQTNQQNNGTSGVNVGSNTGSITINNYSGNPANSGKSNIPANTPCAGRTTGNVLLKNNSNKILYIYYNTANNDFNFTDPITIKPFESELLYDLPVGQTQQYKAVTHKPANRTSMHYIQAETTGRFAPDPCSTREFVIDL